MCRAINHSTQEVSYLPALAGPWRGCWGRQRLQHWCERQAQSGFTNLNFVIKEFMASTKNDLPHFLVDIYPAHWLKFGNVPILVDINLQSQLWCVLCRVYLPLRGTLAAASVSARNALTEHYWRNAMKYCKFSGRPTICTGNLFFFGRNRMMMLWPKEAQWKKVWPCKSMCNHTKHYQQWQGQAMLVASEIKDKYQLYQGYIWSTKNDLPHFLVDIYPWLYIWQKILWNQKKPDFVAFKRFRNSWICSIGQFVLFWRVVLVFSSMWSYWSLLYLAGNVVATQIGLT